jgi:hypothetical protein
VILMDQGVSGDLSKETVWSGLPSYIVASTHCTSSLSRGTGTSTTMFPSTFVQSVGEGVTWGSSLLM